MSKIHQYSSGEAGSIALGQKGSILAKTDAVTAIGGVFVAIQFIEDSVFESGSTGLVAETTQLFPDSTGTGTAIDSNGGAPVERVTFPQGMTIFGRWTGFTLTATGSVIAYVG